MTYRAPKYRPIPYVIYRLCGTCVAISSAYSHHSCIYHMRTSSDILHWPVNFGCNSYNPGIYNLSTTQCITDMKVVI